MPALIVCSSSSFLFTHPVQVLKGRYMNVYWFSKAKWSYRDQTMLSGVSAVLPPSCKFPAVAFQCRQVIMLQIV